jgi:hypothetical protein
MGYPAKPTTKGKSMTQKKNTTEHDNKDKIPGAEEFARELGKATSIDDFYGKEGIFSRLFSEIIEQMQKLS